MDSPSQIVDEHDFPLSELGARALATPLLVSHEAGRAWLVKGLRALRPVVGSPLYAHSFFGSPNGFPAPVYYTRKKGHLANFYKIGGMLTTTPKKRGRKIDGRFGKLPTMQSRV